MPGNHRSGRIRKPIELHLISGSYRRDRHGEKPADVEPPVPIVKPEGMTPEASKRFDELAEQLKPILHPTDVLALSAMCELLALYEKSLVMAQADPTSKTARSAVLAYWTVSERLASRFGLTPADRQRLRVPEKPAEPDAFEKFLTEKREHNQRGQARRK